MAQLTVDLPLPVLERLKRKARAGRRPVADQLVDALTTALNQESPVPSDLDVRLEGMQFLTDQELVKATKSSKARKLVRELASLREKQQQHQLTKDEGQRQKDLLDSLDRLILIRAQALVLLKERGQDISRLLQP